MNQFRVSYKVEGVRVMNVWLPEGVIPPKGFYLWEYKDQDAWLYEHQSKSEVHIEDIHHAEAESVLQVRHLKAVANE
jgi:hypothetical protein